MHLESAANPEERSENCKSEVADKLLSLNSPDLTYCTFYTTTLQNLMEKYTLATFKVLN